MEQCDCSTAPGYRMVELAELITNTVDCADWAFFAKNGGDTTTIAAAAQENGVKLSISGEPSLFYLMIQDDNTLLLHQEWVAEMVKRGVYITNHHNHFTNLSLTDADIDFTGQVADEAFKVLTARHPEVYHK